MTKLEQRIQALDRLAEKRGWSEDERRRRIVLLVGPKHPEFGEAFLRHYLPHYVAQDGHWVEAAEFHRDFEQTAFGSLGTGQWHVWEAFRGSAKSTIAGLAAPLASLGLSGLALQRKLPYRFKPRHYIWLVQDTAPQAKQSMDGILAETERNPRIQRDFPHLSPQLGTHKRPVADRDDDVVFQQDLRLQALGAGQKLRGRKHRQHRPDLVIIDDLEEDETVATKYQRDKLDRWFSSSLLPALAPGADLHFLGTPLHNDALLRRIQQRGRFRLHKYPAVTGWEKCGCWQDGEPFADDRPGDPDCPVCEGRGFVGAPAWPFRGMDYLAGMRMAMGATSFSREYLLTVTDEGRKRFPARWFKHGVRPDPAPTEDGRGVSVRIGVDPAIGQKKENDRSCLVVAMRRRGDRNVHIDYAWGDRLRGKTLVERVKSTWEDYVKLGYAPVVVFEKVQAQAWGAQALEDEHIPVDAVQPSDIGGGDKYVRAEPVSTMYENGQVTHAETLRDGEFENELDEFPDGEHDDYVDALVYAVRRLTDGDSAGGVSGAVENTLPAFKPKPQTGYDPRYA